MQTRRTLLASLAGGVVGLAGCGSAGKRESSGPTGSATDDTAIDETPMATTPDTPSERRGDAQIDLGLSLRYATREPERAPRIEARRTRATHADVVRIDGRSYRPTPVSSRGGMVCQAVPTYHQVVSATETPLQLSDVPPEVTITEATDLPPEGQSLFDRVVATDDGRVTVDSYRLDQVDLDEDALTNVSGSPTTGGDETDLSIGNPGPAATLFDDYQPRYVRVGGRIYWVTFHVEARPSCATADIRAILELEPVDGGPAPDRDVLQAVPLSAGEKRLLTETLSSWVVTRPGVPPEPVRAFAASAPQPTTYGSVDFTLERTDGGYRLAAVRLPTHRGTSLQ